MFSKIILLFMVGVLAFLPSLSISELRKDNKGESYYHDPLSGTKYYDYPPVEMLQGKSPSEVSDRLNQWIGTDSYLKSRVRDYYRCKADLLDSEKGLKTTSEEKNKKITEYNEARDALKRLLLAALGRLGLQTAVVIADATTDIQLGVKKLKDSVSSNIDDIKSARAKAEMIAEFERLTRKAAEIRAKIQAQKELIKALEKIIQARKQDLEKPPLAPKRDFKTKGMEANMVEFDKKLDVTYLSPAERQKFLVTVKDGKVYDSSGKLLDTTHVRGSHGTTGRAIYVMDKEGNIYIHTEPSFSTIHHSSLTAGGEVSAAGEIRIENGKLTYIDRNSGHYRPPPEFLEQAMQRLEDMGIDTSTVVMGGIK